MNCLTGNNTLWILIILLILFGSNALNSPAFTGCGFPVLIALLVCLYKNGTLGSMFGLGGHTCGCNN